jgi:hypothetical protein
LLAVNNASKYTYEVALLMSAALAAQLPPGAHRSE